MTVAAAVDDAATTTTTTNNNNNTNNNLKLTDAVLDTISEGEVIPIRAVAAVVAGAVDAGGLVVGGREVSAGGQQRAGVIVTGVEVSLAIVT